jgi:hypothetical protein
MIAKSHKAILLAAALWFLVASTFIAHMSGLLQLATMLASFPYIAAVIYSVVEAVRGWRTYKARALIPVSACVLAWFGSGAVGKFVQDQLFMHNLPRYQAIVSSVNVASLPVAAKAEPIELSSENQKLVYFALAERTQDGALLVELLTEGGFPVKHCGYVFSSSGALPSDAFIGKRWPYVRKVQSKWFRVAD